MVYLELVDTPLVFKTKLEDVEGAVPGLASGERFQPPAPGEEGEIEAEGEEPEAEGEEPEAPPRSRRLRPKRPRRRLAEEPEAEPPTSPPSRG